MTTALYICSSCDAQFPKWSGRCLECGTWGSLAQGVAKKNDRSLPQSAHATATPLEEIESGAVPRITTGMGEVDQVLGGGIVPGSLILLGGEPGIGKSTLILEIALTLSKKHQKPILYCSGEESGHQIKLRYDRLKRDGSAAGSILFTGDTDCDAVCAKIAADKPLLAIIDSIQTISTSQVESEAGSVPQVRACTVKCLETAKKHGVPIIITGHVTKEGMVAGPKTLEHLVDTVLYLEGDGNHYFRILRTVKNRFGSTNEIGVFEMSESGLLEISNPSQLFIDSGSSHAPGSATVAVIEGSRPFLVQVQSLTSKTYFGYPQRRAVGFDVNRLQLLIAVLSKRVGLNLGDQDVHVNIAGGMKISEPALDLAVCASIMSAYANKPLPQNAVFFGEVGLSGEIRPVSGTDKRLKEAEKLGFTAAYLPNQKTPSSIVQLMKLKHIKEFEL